MNIKEKDKERRLKSKVLWSFGAPLVPAGIIALAFPDCQAWINICLGLVLMLLSAYYWKID